MKSITKQIENDHTQQEKVIENDQLSDRNQSQEGKAERATDFQKVIENDHAPDRNQSEKVIENDQHKRKKETYTKENNICRESKTEKPKKKPEPTPEQISIAETMASDVRARFPKQEIIIGFWADDIRKLMDLDGHSKADIVSLWRWIQSHGNPRFSWANQIRTPGKLRQRDNQGLKYFDRLSHEKNKNTPTPPPSQPKDYSYGVDANGHF